jgi:hypothetical protein
LGFWGRWLGKCRDDYFAGRVRRLVGVGFCVSVACMLWAYSHASSSAIAKGWDLFMLGGNQYWYEVIISWLVGGRWRCRPAPLPPVSGLV